MKRREFITLLGGAAGGRVPKDRLVLLRVGGQHSGHRQDES
ncbi:MAG TPA: hypothetical protein VKB89_03740 [Xanthobacteraceae bacterium]|nr:hypothetical protein [Xanthobacteraceae bacterium]